MRQDLQATITDICQKLFDTEANVELTRPDEQFGDFATNVAMQLAGKLKKNPREIAEQIQNELQETDSIEKVAIAGPGFINLTLTNQALIGLAEEKGIGTTSDTIVIETNNPNPFKPMHIGHAYNAIVADTLANILDEYSTAVNRVSYHGDVGAHVGKSMYSILKWMGGDDSKLQDIRPEDRNSFMATHYRDGATAYNEDEAAKKEIDILAKQSFTQDDPLYKKVYNTIFEWSFEDMATNLKKIGNKPTKKRYLESQADPIGVDIVKKHVGDVFEESDGALVFHGDKHGSFTNVFVASNGQGLYGARDLGLMHLKNQDFNPQKSYIITGNEQKDYFKGVIAAAELCEPKYKGVTTNIPTGTVKLSTGKMSSRTGEVLDIGWLFEQIESAVKEQGSAADDILVGAIRYEFLKVKVGHDVVFDVGESVSIKGNSGPYLQYAHARACSILSKTSKNKLSDNLEADERSLLRKVGTYQEVLELTVKELKPHHVSVYLYELAQKFNSFYEHNRVVGDDREAVRAALVRLYKDTLKAGLTVLGIPAPERM